MSQRKATLSSLLLAFTSGDALQSCIMDSVLKGSPPGKVKLLDQVRGVIRVKHYSLRTEQTYLDWIKRFILFHRKRHPETMGAAEVSEFLSHLASERDVAASTQNQAFSALLFLYREVLKTELPWINDIERAKRPAKLPVVFTPDEAKAVLSKMHGTALLMGQLL